MCREVHRCRPVYELQAFGTTVLDIDRLEYPVYVLKRFPMIYYYYYFNESNYDVQQGKHA